jgi:hypothetical protein
MDHFPLTFSLYFSEILGIYCWSLSDRQQLMFGTLGFHYFYLVNKSSKFPNIRNATIAANIMWGQKQLLVSMECKQSSKRWAHREQWWVFKAYWFFFVQIGRNDKRWRNTIMQTSLSLFSTMDLKRTIFLGTSIIEEGSNFCFAGTLGRRRRLYST